MGCKEDLCPLRSRLIFLRKILGASTTSRPMRSELSNNEGTSIFRRKGNPFQSLTESASESKEIKIRMSLLLLIIFFLESQKSHTFLVTTESGGTKLESEDVTMVANSNSYPNIVEGIRESE